MSSKERVPLLDARLELTRHLTADERAELANVGLPVITLDPGPVDLTTLLARHNAFGATVLDGIVMTSLNIGEQAGIQLLGPGALLMPDNGMLPEWVGGSRIRTTQSVRLGLFGNDLLAAAYRWPRVVIGLFACLGEQLQRLTAQMVICQLPRVDERVVAIMWLLAESWGQVTASGVRLPLTLTHETLGALIGARRPTVTLALRKLTEKGALIHQDSGWLLLEPPPQPAPQASNMLPPAIPAVSLARWAAEAEAEAEADPSVVYAELRDTVRRLREQHRLDRQQTRERINRMQTARVRVSAVREQIAQAAVKRRQPPSS
jgi:CRP/FNR family transcriptional regulator, cyclic AMP receptor protein